MAVSSSFDFTLTGDQIIEAALRKVNAIGQGDSALAIQITNHRMALNLICKELVNESVGLFTTEKYPIIIASAEVTMTIATPCVITWTAHGRAIGDSFTLSTTGALPAGLTAGTVYYIITTGFGANSFQCSATLGGSAVNTSGTQSGTHTATSYASFVLPTKYIDILSAYIHYSGVDTPVGILTKGQYHSIENKAQTGVPEYIMLDFTGTPMVYVYPIPNVSCTINLVVFRLMDDFDATADNPGLPVKWFRFLVAALSSEIAPDYGLPLGERDRLSVDAEKLKIRAMATDFEKTGVKQVMASVPVI